MPKDYKSFCLVTAHLVKNAHRYYKDALQETEQIAAEIPVKKEVEVKSEFAEKEPKLELIDEMPPKKKNRLYRCFHAMQRGESFIARD